ncbi:MAG TPA: response regulator transcription factor [Planktothrix sp.]|jgi:two-component system OmpR family response regulator
MAKILVVEDDKNSAEMLSTWLRAERHVVDVAYDGPSGLEHMRQIEYDIILLDWDLPGMSGYDLLRKFRTDGKSTPVLMLTAKGEIDSKEAGFDGGADDYLTKPYSMKELSARIRALQRRASHQIDNQLTARQIVLNPEQMKVTRDGKTIDLLPREFSLLEFFMRNPDRVFTAEAVMQRVWHSETDASTNAFRSALKRLRQKLEADDETNPLIETVHGAGYRFNSGN